MLNIKFMLRERYCDLDNSSCRFEVMKATFILITILFFSFSSFAQTRSDSINEAKTNNVTLFESSAAFPGGNQAFMMYVGKKIRTSELAKLFGYKGHVIMEFTVDSTGFVKNIKKLTESGLVYEEQLVNIIQASPRWKPARQNGRNVDEKFSLPFSIDDPREKVLFRDLKKSSYQFSFWINDKQYDISQAEAILGKSFDPNKINYNKSSPNSL